jgi:hypothetical protein
MHRIWSAVAVSAVLLLAGVLSGSASPGCAVAGELVQAQVSIFYSGAWHVITADTRMPIHISRGMPNEASRSDPAVITLRLNNGASNVEPSVVGRYSPKNPRSDLFGLIGRGTPVKVEAGLVGGSLTTRVVGEVVQWPARWDVSQRDLWVDLEVSGILRRLGSSGRPLSDPIARLVAVHGASAYWPLDALEGSRQSPGLVGGGPMRTVDNTKQMLYGTGFLASYLPVAPLSGPVNGVVEASVFGGPSGGAVLDWAVRTTPPSQWSSTNTPQIHEAAVDTSGTVDIRFALNIVSGGLTAGIVDLDTSSTIASDTATVDIEDGQLHHIRMSAVEASGTNATITVAVDGVEVATATGDIGAAAIPRVNSVSAANTTSAGDAEPITFGQFILWGSSAPTLAQAYAAYTGHANETAGNRVVRLCAEEGVTLTAFGDLDGSMPMGAQRSADLLALLDECAATEASGSRLPILTETRDELGLTFRTRRSLYLIS